MGRIICIKIGVKNRSVKYFFDNTITLYGGGGVQNFPPDKYKDNRSKS